jgi:hypothetical protein
MKILALDGLHERHPGLTPCLGQSYVKAACVCFSRHHKPPLAVVLKHGGSDEHRKLDFTVPQLKRGRVQSPGTRGAERLGLIAGPRVRFAR